MSRSFVEALGRFVREYPEQVRDAPRLGAIQVTALEPDPIAWA